MDGRTTERVDADMIGVVDRRRLEGASVAAACREAGISTSTYYRKKRAGLALAELASDRVNLHTSPPETVGLMVKGESRSWPFTARAPFYWDQVFAEELSDSYVRREFGRGPQAVQARGALTALAAPRPMDSAAFGALRDLARRLSRSPLKAAVGPLAAAVFLAVVAAASVWMVSVAADPAAWIDPGQSRVADAASATFDLP